MSRKRRLKPQFRCAKCEKDWPTLAEAFDCYFNHVHLVDGDDESPALTTHIWQDEERLRVDEDAILEGYGQLFVTLMEEVHINPLYVTGPCGRTWCRMYGVSPSRVWELASLGQPWAGIHFKSSRLCSSPFHKKADLEWTTERRVHA